MAASDGKEAEKTGFYDEEENLKKLCNFLRSTEGPKVREAVEMDKRVYYLKGVYVAGRWLLVASSSSRDSTRFCFLHVKLFN